MVKYRRLVFSWCVLSALFLSGTIARAQWAPGAKAGAESRIYYGIDRDNFLPSLGDDENWTLHKAILNALFASGVLVKSSGVQLGTRFFYASNLAKCKLRNDREDHYNDKYLYPIHSFFCDTIRTQSQGTQCLSVYLRTFQPNYTYSGVANFIAGDPSTAYIYAKVPDNNTQIVVDTVDQYIYSTVISFSIVDFRLPTQKDVELDAPLGLPVRTSGALDARTVTILAADMQNLTGTKEVSLQRYDNVWINGPGGESAHYTWADFFGNERFFDLVSQYQLINERFKTAPSVAPWLDTDTDDGGMQDYDEWRLNKHNWWGNPLDDDDYMYSEPDTDEPPELDPGEQVVDIGELTGEYLEWLIGEADPQGGGGAPLPAMPVPATLEGEFEAPTPDSFEAPPIDVNQDKADLEAQFRQEFAQNGWTTAINAFTDPQFNSMTLPDEVFNPVIAVGSFANGDQASSLDLGNHIVSVTGELSEFAGQDKLNIIRLALKAVLIIGTGWALIRLLMSTINGAKTDD